MEAVYPFYIAEISTVMSKLKLQSSNGSQVQNKYICENEHQTKVVRPSQADR
jgi:hypothetical protein